jgi:hypothetical protein
LVLARGGCWRYVTSFLAGSRFSQISPVVPAFGFGMCFLAGFTCTWFTAFRLSKFVSTFYDYVSNESALHHYAESPLRLTGAAFVQVLIVNAGLLFISFSTLQVLPLREQIVLSGILLVLFAIATLLLLVGPGTIRWVVGHAAFTTGISCSLYVLLPLIIFGLSLEDVRRAAAAPGLGWHQVGAILVIAFTVGLILKAVSNASSLAHNIDYWRNHVQSHRWMTRWNRLALGLIALPVLVVTGSLALIAGGHSLLFLQSHLLGDYAWHARHQFRKTLQRHCTRKMPKSASRQFFCISSIHAADRTHASPALPPKRLGAGFWAAPPALCCSVQFRFTTGPAAHGLADR